MSGFFEKYKEQFIYSDEERLAVDYCNHTTENLDEEIIFDWCEERIMYDDLNELEAGNIEYWVRRAGNLDDILFRSAITKVCGAYWLDNGGVPPDSRNLASKMNY